MKRNTQRGSVKRVTSAQSRPRVVVRKIVQTIERPVPPMPTDMVEARKNTSDVVRCSAMDIIDALIQKAKDGEVGPAKYLFEMVGLYPATEETSSKPEDSLAYTLLQRMGLPTELDGPGQPLPDSGQ